MTGFKIIPLTRTGKVALLQAIQENREELKSRSLREQAIFKAFTIETINESSYYLTSRIYPYKLPGIDQEKFKKIFEEKLPEMSYQVELCLTKNGALKNIDYTIEVI